MCTPNRGEFAYKLARGYCLTMANPRAVGQSTRFKPGQSGNPSGRPQGAKIVAKMIADKTRDGEEIVDEVLKIARQEGKYSQFGEKSVCWAWDWLGKRRWGAPPVVIEEGAAERPQVKGTLTQDELRILCKLDAPGLEIDMSEAANGTGVSDDSDADGDQDDPEQEPTNGDGSTGPN